MFKIIKLLGYGLLGYLLYELIQGVRGQMDEQQGSSQGGRTAHEPGESSAMGGAYGQLTGPGVGRTEVTADDRGEQVPHQVGRGVI